VCIILFLLDHNTHVKHCHPVSYDRLFLWGEGGGYKIKINSKMNDGLNLEFGLLQYCSDTADRGQVASRYHRGCALDCRVRFSRSGYVPLAA
jgi:hypothetical protein